MRFARVNAETSGGLECRSSAADKYLSVCTIAIPDWILRDLLPAASLSEGQQGTSIVDLYWAGCIINMSGFDLRQAQRISLKQKRDVSK
jgi:hypothetical protein